MLLLLIPLGMVLDGLTLMLIVVPLVAPTVTGLGLDGVWYGVLVLKAVEIGLITPPVGLNVFIISAATGAKVEHVFRFLGPFVVLDLSVTAVLFVFPDIVPGLDGALRERSLASDHVATYKDLADTNVNDLLKAYRSLANWTNATITESYRRGVPDPFWHGLVVFILTRRVRALWEGRPARPTP